LDAKFNEVKTVSRALKSRAIIKRHRRKLQEKRTGLGPHLSALTNAEKCANQKKSHRVCQEFWTRGTVELHFFTHSELRPAKSCAGCYIRVLDVESIYRAFTLAQLPRRGIPRLDALENKPWGMREFAIVDPDGNLLRIGQTL
jgi:ribosomal protein L32